MSEHKGTFRPLLQILQDIDIEAEVRCGTVILIIFPILDFKTLFL